jgi:D-alanine-D-alanine ligase
VKVLILHTLPPEETGADRWQCEFDLQTSVDGILAVLPGAVAAGVRGEPVEILNVISRVSPVVVFNLCEAPLGKPSLEPQAAGLFEWLGVPFTGSGSEALALCRRKDLTKKVLSGAGVPVPGSNGFPCIVKPAGEDGSACIYTDSVCNNAVEMERAIARLRGPALVEEFLPGREFAVSLWGKTEPEYVSIAETIFQGGVRLLTYEGKWDSECYDYLNTPLVYHGSIDEALHARIVAVAKGAWLATGLRGYARIDVRCDSQENPRVLDVNPNPALNPGVGVYRAAEETGWTWARFVNQQLQWAL